MSKEQAHGTEPPYWECYMFGNTPGGVGMVYRPRKGDVPNVFVRWMMYRLLACKWVKVTE